MSQGAPPAGRASAPDPQVVKQAIAAVIESRSLSEQLAYDAMAAIMEGQATPAQIAGLVVGLRMKGETVEELTGFARAMRERCALIAPQVEGRLTDTCGTGGAPIKTFNVSTLSAFVAAGAGIPIAKHGNRAVTSKCGSADVLEALGANLALEPGRVKSVIETVGVGFLFAPNFHPAMRHAIGPRRELGVRTVFNILGPLTNPAGAKGQVLGVYHPSLVQKMTQVLANLGVQEAMVVHGEGGLDEISPFGPTRVGRVQDGKVSYFSVNPEEFGFARVSPEEVAGGDPKESARVFLTVLRGEPGPRANTVLMNAAAAAVVGGRAKDLKAGVLAAKESIESGRALQKLTGFVEATGGQLSEA
ncbi:MAG TPA: anthranilate phosphoribosyltransferase [Candidatus Thermoplasmatota archaeon]|nr:anthranilate phosphoribosyltransferase [Candidatus Thermoplasmatota archaeon]